MTLEELLLCNCGKRYLLVGVQEGIGRGEQTVHGTLLGYALQLMEGEAN